MIDNKKLVVVCGPTATGKTNFALNLAKKISGELVSVDSRQLYKHLTIGTGKDLPANAKFVDRSDHFKKRIDQLQSSADISLGHYDVGGVSLWLYDMITPKHQMNAFEFAVCARGVIDHIWSIGKTPILVGGTGLYINAVVYGFSAESTPPNPKLRDSLNKESVVGLQQALSVLNKSRFDRMNNSDSNNPRRLIRAIEIETYKKLYAHKKGFGVLKPIKTMTSFIGLKYAKGVLLSKIDKRVDTRIQNGVLNEINNILKMGYSWSDPGLDTLGYKQLRPYYEQKQPLKNCVFEWKTAEQNYAKRQLTWFNKDTRIVWQT